MTGPDEDRLTPVAALFMVLVLLWAGGLAAGFGYAAADGGGLSGTKRLGFTLVALFLGLLALRTGYELVRRLVARARR